MIRKDGVFFPASNSRFAVPLDLPSCPEQADTLFSCASAVTGLLSRLPACLLSRVKPFSAWCIQERTTAGVSYVLASSSMQCGVSPAQPVLPPTVIRPLPAVVSPQYASEVAAAVNRLVETALHQVCLNDLRCAFLYVA